MSYTPIIIVEKESFDKHFGKIEQDIDTYHDKRNSHYSETEDMQKEEERRLENNAHELGISVDGKKIRETAEKKMKESAEYKKHCKDETDYWGLGEILWGHKEDEFTAVGDNNYYVFNCEMSCQANDLEEFCRDHEIKFGVDN